VLCASDPYAVIGVMKAYGAEPDFVTGPASNTQAGLRLVEQLADVQALNILDRSVHPRIDALLRDRLEVAPP